MSLIIYKFRTCTVFWYKRRPIQTTLQSTSGECAAVCAFLAHCHVDQFYRFLFKKCQRRINGAVSSRRGMLTHVRSG